MTVIYSYEHVGIRVTELQRALVFYKMLGFSADPNEIFPEHCSVGIINEAGVRINLIHGAEKRVGNRNVLIDEYRKYPGVTHIAFVVTRIQDIMGLMEDAGIPITEGPMKVGDRRTVCFVRDPDGNVIEFDQLSEDQLEKTCGS